MQTPTTDPIRSMLRAPGRRHDRPGRPLVMTLAVAPLLLAGGWALLVTPSLALTAFVLGAAAQLALLLLLSLRVAAPWERAVIFRDGRVRAVRGPGIYALIPLVEDAILVDVRLRALPIPRRRFLSLDQKRVWVEGTLFYQIDDPARSVLACRDLATALARLAQSSMLSVSSRLLLGTLQSRPEQVENEVQAELVRRACDWGLRVDGVRVLAVEPVDEPISEDEAQTDVKDLSLPPAVPVSTALIHDFVALGQDPADEVVLFPAAVGRSLPRAGELPRSRDRRQ